MPICLFCLRDEEADALTFTDEHLFPAALGGNLVIKDGSCGGCNHGNSKFEQALAAELTPIRMLLQIPDRYGKVPRTAATIVAPSETYKGHVQSDGKVVLTPSVTRETNEKGEHEAVYRFLTDARKEELRAKAKNKGQRLIEMGPGDPVTVEVHIGGDLVVIGSEAGLRMVAKIAYTGLVHLAGVRIVTSDAFREVRQFIFEGTPQGVARLFVNHSYLKACEQGPHQHSVAIAARRDIHRVDAIVRLFGELTYFVVLSDHYDGPDFVNTLVYDAYRGEENGIFFAHIQAELLQTEEVRNDKETVWDDVEHFVGNFCEFLDRALKQRGIQDLGEINAPG
ncbi:HNH endonuclease [Acidicapsa dinghuensis]|uniref:HNH endonuclease n=1 Tax=Acidicapsa dinghuensis TaxID=2218256 RepID=A0ABW1EHS8_9BACT|nr:HNH endonuclease [Acidicapsa dinghuensis]